VASVTAARERAAGSDTATDGGRDTAGRSRGRTSQFAEE
jgi:hypothetical protein